MFNRHVHTSLYLIKEIELTCNDLIVTVKKVKDVRMEKKFPRKSEKLGMG